MTPQDPRPDDGPELVPPAELLRLRNLLMRPPAASLRAQHLAATAVASRQRSMVGPVGRFASRGARLAVGIVASLAITSGLAGAQLLPPTAQRLFSSFSDTFAPSDAPTPTTIDEPAGGSSPEADGSDSSDGDGGAAPADSTTSSTETAVTLASPTTTSTPPVTTTTLLGPIGPGSPDDPTDPGSTTTTTEPTTTTTTEPGTTTTTEPGTTTSSSSTTSTTAPPR